MNDRLLRAEALFAGLAVVSAIGSYQFHSTRLEFFAVLFAAVCATFVLVRALAPPR